MTAPSTHPADAREAPAPHPPEWQRAHADVVAFMLAHQLRAASPELGLALRWYAQATPAIHSHVRTATAEAMRTFEWTYPGVHTGDCRCRQVAIALAMNERTHVWSTSDRMLRAMHRYLDERN